MDLVVWRDLRAGVFDAHVLERVIEAAGGDDVELRIELPEARARWAEGAGSPVAPSSARPSAPVERAPRAARSAPVLPWIATGSLTAAAAVTRVIAPGASADLQAALDAFLSHAQRLDREPKTAATLALTADLGACLPPYRPCPDAGRRRVSAVKMLASSALGLH